MAEHEAQQSFLNEFLFQQHLGGVRLSEHVKCSVISDQNDYLSRAEAGVENRQATEDVNTATSELYDEELDNYAGSIDLIDEIEITESTATETPIVALDETTSEEEPVAGNDNTAENQTPQFGLLTVGSANGEDSKPTDKGDDDKKEEV